MFRPRKLRNAAVAGLLVLLVSAATLWAQTPPSDPLLKMVPAETLFCVRVNNFDFTMSQIDQFLAGASPMPMGVSMLVRMQLAKVLGSPQLTGLNMNGSFAVFGAMLGGASTEAKPAQNVFVGVLAPVTDYKLFLEGNANCGQPDERGVSKITSNGTDMMVVTQADQYALMGWANDYEKLLTAAKEISADSATGLANALDAAEAKQAVTRPVWVYGNIQQVSKTFGPMVFGKIEEIKTMMKSMEASQPGTQPENIQGMIDMYVGVLEMLMKETQSLSITVDPKPNVLSITKTISAIPGTDMAKMFVADASAGKENELLVYLEDGAMMNFGLKMGTPLWKQMNAKGVDLLCTAAGESMTAEDAANMKALAADVIDCLSGPMAASISIIANNKPPFAAQYVVSIKDEQNFNRLIEEGIQMFNTGGIKDFYRGLGLETNFVTEQAVDSYKGVSIDSARLTMQSTDANSPQGQMINAMYGGGFDYRWAMMDGLWVCAVGGDASSTIHQMIDRVKASGEKQLGAEMKAALALLPEAGKADFVGTYNLLRFFDMMKAMAPVPVPPMDVPTKSNIVFAGKVGDGKMVADIAVPKEHLTEVMTGVMTMQQKMMQQKQQTMQQTP